MNLFDDPSEKPESGAIISECGKFRYHLWRIWDRTLPSMVFVMQNPSVADAKDNDPTITRCIGFAKREGFGGISVRNVFAYRATDEKELLKCPDPFGPENEQHLLHARDVSLMTRLVIAWGKHFGSKRLADYYRRALSILLPQKPYCLGTNKDGTPRHPLFLASNTPLIEYKS